MEILKKNSASYGAFKVLKPFRWGGYITEPGQELQMGSAEGLGMVRIKKVVPADIPEIGKYVCLHDITLPGSKEAFKAKRLEVVEVKAGDALRLMLEGGIIPLDVNQWRPHNRKLRRGPDRSQRDKAAMQKKMSDDQLYKIGIHPSMTKK
jgi:hypothetical protein